MVLISSITMRSLVGLGLHTPPGWGQKRSTFLSVAPSNNDGCERHFATKASVYRNGFGTVG